MYLDAVRCEYTGSSLCKSNRLVAAVVGDSNTRLSKVSLDIVGKPLGCTADSVDVHAVCTSAEYTAQTAGTEFKITIETITDLGFVSLNGLELGNQIRIINGLLTPYII